MIGLSYKPRMKTKICLSLTEKTLSEDLKIFNKYKDEVDILELRVDCLSKDELFNVHTFPSLVDLPVILTVRREKDGGNFTYNEVARTMLFSLALNFTDSDIKKFAFVDLESDFFAPRLEYACKMYGIRIIRSLHSIKEAIKDFDVAIKELKKNTYDIIKIASYSSSLKDTLLLFQATSKLKNEDFVLVAMGDYGLCSRILANFIGSCFVYTFSENYIKEHASNAGLLDPHTLLSIYNFNRINSETHIFGVVGKAVNSSLSPSIHNAKFRENNINSVYIPILAKNIEEACDFVKTIGIRAISVTAPFKESIIPYIDELNDVSSTIKSVNTVSCFGKNSIGYNVDVYGFEKALLEFLKGNYPMKVSVLGAGGASKAICYVLKKLNFKNVVVFNRTLEKAKAIASVYNFDFALLDSSSLEVLKKHSDLIINATSVGMSSNENVLPFYEFLGHEYVFDLIYNPEKTKLLQNAEEKHCKICNGLSMLKYQAEKQFNIFMGDKHDKH